ncbi:hypothetical protein P1X14_14860 [Sphingomonas sp. AOB5]|uniref:hypothetical protein n=1 Tax=Sphingomonas sp. AOB5 TaxID=3034017 RepID=UPI0023F9F9C8|nr:hypothetical protein [Sphingomonas sp. AOB5]MDF7776534.1 hypothetical protein [Sphingomonas sp. AOB5]
MTTETTANETPVAPAAEEPKSFFEQAQDALEAAQEKISDAIESTVEAAKENPVAAAAIAAGAVAAVGAAAYGISQLVGGEDEAKK